MARKSNKTEHVLNLLSGHDTKTETAEETESSAPKTPPAAAGSPSKDTPETAVPQTVSVIDTTEEDPLAELIQNKLSDEFGKQLSEETENQKPKVSEPEAAETAAEPENTAIPEPVAEPENTAIPEPAAEPENTAIPEPIAEPETTAIPEPVAEPETTEPVAEQQSAVSSTITEPEPEDAVSNTKSAPEPEPDFVPVNVMERIVKDKIDYYMDQFEVCKCDRCRADAIALTLTGLQPRYIVTSPAAVDPLLSYYTNKYNTDVIVQATKACMTVKEKPRH